MCIQFLDQNYLCYLYFGAYIHFVYFLDCILHTYPPPSLTFLFGCGIWPAQGRSWGLSLDVGLLLPHPQNWYWRRWMVRPLRSNMTMENPSIWRCISCWKFVPMSCHVSFQRSRCWTKVDLWQFSTCFHHVSNPSKSMDGPVFLSSPYNKKQRFLIFPKFHKGEKRCANSWHTTTYRHGSEQIKKHLFHRVWPPSYANPFLNEDRTDFGKFWSAWKWWSEKDENRQPFLQKPEKLSVKIEFNRCNVGSPAPWKTKKFLTFEKMWISYTRSTHGRVKHDPKVILLMVQKSGQPVGVGSLSHYLRGFYIPGGCLGFLPSTVPSLTDGILRSFSTWRWSNVGLHPDAPCMLQTDHRWSFPINRWVDTNSKSNATVSWTRPSDESQW